MAIQLIVDNVEVPIKKILFSDGGSNLKLEVPQALKDFPPQAYYSLVVAPTTPVDNYLWEILQTVDAIEQTFGNVFKRELLYLPYLPHARADRVFEYGNGFPLKLFLDAVSWMFDTIFLTDPHSDYYEVFQGSDGTINFEVKTQHSCFMEVAGQDIRSGDILISPDRGALNKIYKLQKALVNRNISTSVVEAGKKREIETGRIIETTLPNFDYNDKIVWIVDDLLDAGGTFIPLAKLLKGKGVSKVNLYVTHFIGAKGLDMFRGIIDNIHTYQTVGSYVNRIDIENFNKGI